MVLPASVILSPKNTITPMAILIQQWTFCPPNCITSILTENDTSKAILALDKESHIEKIKYNAANIYILDSKGGCLYKICGQVNTRIFNLPNVIWIFIIIFIMSIIIALMYKSKIIKK